MGTPSIYHLMKHDIYDYRKVLLCCLLIPFALFVIIIWKDQFIITYVAQKYASWIVEVLFTSVFVGPFLVVWILLTVRIRSEAQSGFYTYMKVLPLTPKALVTAKFLTSFIVLIFTFVWLVLLWWGTTHYIPLLDQGKLWAYIYTYGFIGVTWLALHHAFFFKSEAKESWGILFLLLIIFFTSQRTFAQNWFESFQHMLQQHPWLFISIGSVLVITIWIFCWIWAIRTYRNKGGV